jgi:hypothetical protein
MMDAQMVKTPLPTTRSPFTMDAQMVKTPPPNALSLHGAPILDGCTDGENPTPKDCLPKQLLIPVQNVP